MTLQGSTEYPDISAVRHVPEEIAHQRLNPMRAPGSEQDGHWDAEALLYVKTRGFTVQVNVSQL